MNQRVTPGATLDVALVGAGRVGTAVAALLHRKGHRIVGVASRTRTSAERAAQRLAAPVVDPEPGAWPPAQVVLIGAPDDAIAAVAEALAPVLAPDTFVCHFAGALGTEPLDALSAAGHRVAALHPVQACPDVETAVRRLPGSAWGITCDDAVMAWARDFVSLELDGDPVPVPPEARPLWHAAAVTTSNGIAALMAAGEAILSAAGISDPVAVLGPLAAGTVANAREGGGGGRTLTGPVVRGESTTIARHLDALRAHAPELLPQYLLAAQLVFAAASSAGRLDLDRRLILSDLLEDR